VAGERSLVLQNLDFVAVGVGDEGHLFILGEFLAPVAGPKAELEVQLLQHFAVGDDVVHADAGVHEVLGKFDSEVGRIGQLQFMRTAGDLQVGELVAAGRLVGALEHFEAAGAAIPVDRLFQIGDADTGVVEGDVHGIA